jgi:hypothetical protein
VSPEGDVETINTELILADLQTLERAIPRLEKEARVVKDRRAALDNALAAQKVLEEGETLYASGAAAGVDLAEARGLSLLTTKPFIYVFNLSESQLTDSALIHRLRGLVGPADSVFLDAKLEADLAELDPDEALELLQSVGAEESGLDQLARVGFHTLGLQTYLTAGPKESRAWTIHQGWTAPQAAGVIHTDFQRGFIKAEVVSFEDLVAAGSMNAAKAAGRVRIEGKDYVMATATWSSSDTLQHISRTLAGSGLAARSLTRGNHHRSWRGWFPADRPAQGMRRVRLRYGVCRDTRVRLQVHRIRFTRHGRVLPRPEHRQRCSGRDPQRPDEGARTDASHLPGAARRARR